MLKMDKLPSWNFNCRGTSGRLARLVRKGHQALKERQDFQALLAQA